MKTVKYNTPWITAKEKRTIKKHTIATMIAVSLLLNLACGSSLSAQELKSSQSLEYELALQRGTQAVIWSLPAVSMKSFCGSIQTQLGAKENDIVYFSKPMVSRHGFLTANNNVPYVALCLDTRGGPVVLDGIDFSLPYSRMMNSPGPVDLLRVIHVRIKLVIVDG